MCSVQHMFVLLAVSPFIFYSGVMNMYIRVQAAVPVQIEKFRMFRTIFWVSLRES